MRVLVTGSHGYIGSVLTPLLRAEGHQVVGVDADWFEPCTLGPRPTDEPPCWKCDVRALTARDLRGCDAVIHLAALSNDSLGDLDPSLTYEINHQATVQLARMAREARVARFLVSSSCSTYGASGADLLTEEAEFNPVTAYGHSKVLADREIAALADDRFSPTFLRNATAYGASPRLRLDLVLNDFVANAFTTGKIRILSDGTPWRPLVHVEDICRAFLAILSAPRVAVHNQAFNVGQSSENYRVSELAEIVRQTVPGCVIEYAGGGSPDKRCYRIDCGKIARVVPGFRPRWNARLGAEQLYAAYRENGLTAEDLTSTRYFRLRRIRELLNDGLLDAALHWRSSALLAARQQAAPALQEAVP